MLRYNTKSTNYKSLLQSKSARDAKLINELIKCHLNHASCVDLDLCLFSKPFTVANQMKKSCAIGGGRACRSLTTNHVHFGNFPAMCFPKVNITVLPTCIPFVSMFFSDALHKLVTHMIRTTKLISTLTLHRFAITRFVVASCNYGILLYDLSLKL